MSTQILPHDTIFRFYEGSDRSLYTPLTGKNLNSAVDDLLENDKVLLANQEEIKASILNIEDLSIVYAIALG